MLVLSALKPRSFTCLPSFTRSSSERTGSTPITLGVAEAVAAAMRPVERQAIAHRPAEQGVDRNAQRLGLDVEQRVLDGGHRLLVHAARRLAGDGVLPRHDALDRPRVLADQVLRHAADHGGEAGAAVALVVFRPADQPVVGGDLEEREVAPAGVAMQDPRSWRFSWCFLHMAGSIDQTRRCSMLAAGERPPDRRRPSRRRNVVLNVLRYRPLK